MQVVLSILPMVSCLSVCGFGDGFLLTGYGTLWGSSDLPFSG
jgi:hypothetical protein